MILIFLDGPSGQISTTTDAAGAYIFADLGPGAYILGETNPDPLTWGQSQPGGAGVYPITGQSGTDLTGIDFGNYRHAAINGRKYQDNNFNGVRNAGDPYLGGWTIELTSLRDGTKQSAITKVNAPNKGGYAFTNLRPGAYIVRELLQNGWLPVSPNNTLHHATVVSGQELEDLNFGNNTILNYAIWRISNPGSFVSPLTIQGDQALVPPLDTQVSPQANAAAPLNITLPPAPVTTITPPPTPTAPSWTSGLVQKAMERIKRWLP